MTREEAIAYGKRVIDFGFNDGVQAFCELAIQALEQEPCDNWCDVPTNEMTLEQARQAVKDLRKKLAEYLRQESCNAVSRQTVKDKMIKYGFHAPDMTVTEFVDGLPPVNPQLKMVTNANEAEAYPISEELQWFDIA